MGLTVLRKYARRANQARRIEHSSRIGIVQFEESPGLNVDAVVPGAERVPFRVLVGDRYRKLFFQLRRGGVDRRSMGKPWKHHQTDRGKGLITQHRRVDHFEHAINTTFDLGSRGGTRKICLAAGGVVAIYGIHRVENIHHRDIERAEVKRGDQI